ncbi:MAG: CapA family protein [Anaerolineae bacterium]|nr:CapA family protein [Anaerolineae bacterium]
MNNAASRRLKWLLLLLLVVGLALVALGSCGPAYRFDITPTPTRTPRPTLTPTPTATPTPIPTPTPAWPVTVGCATAVPDAACSRLRETVDLDSGHFAWADDPLAADVRLDLQGDPGALGVGTWAYALAAPFYTIEDAVSLADLQAAWAGTPAGPWVGRTLLLAADTADALAVQWGAPAGGIVRVVEAGDMLADALQADAWAILPFHELEPRWKVLRIDGLSPLERGDAFARYPLSVALYLSSERRPDALGMLPGDLANRDESRLAVVIMTGVTALTRGTAQTMESRGTTYPAQDIGDWLRSADLTHVSNEVSFTPDCPVPPQLGTMTFCSHDRYIELLEAAEVDVIELTGNHNNDYGIRPNLHTLDMFRERGWRWFGGGTDLAEATRPLTVTIGPNRLAFVGCNAVGPAYAWATEESPGAAPCDWEALRAQVTALRAAGWLPICTVQAYETYEYFPTAAQRDTFRALADAGAVLVQGSQAHQPQGFDFRAGALIHYGLGNLFFDQMQSLETRQEFVDRLFFYDGRLLSVELLTAMLEEYARPRPMTAEERRALLEAVFAVSGWGE